MNIAGASALVTGGASGLGAATTRALLDAGAAVVVADLPAQRGSSQAEFGDKVTFVAVDVTAEDQVVAAVRAAVELGPLRVAVNCAGMGDQHRMLGSRGVLDLDNVRKVLDVNFVGTVSVMAHAAQAMSANDPVDGDRGVIVNVASIAGLDGASIAYGGSKAAVAGITVAAARELGKHAVRVNCIAPGMFDTAMLAGMSEGARKTMGDLPHPQRTGRPEEFASTVRHIVDNGILNGETIRLDAGMRVPFHAPR